MQIDARHVVLWVLAELDGRPNGKTYLQKLCFFVGNVLGQDFEYRAHYYGPYSDQVASEIGFLNANDYIYESRKGSGVADSRGWEVMRFDYRLTERGTAGVQWLDQQHPAQSQAVVQPSSASLEPETSTTSGSAWPRRPSGSCMAKESR